MHGQGKAIGICSWQQIRRMGSLSQAVTCWNALALRFALGIWAPETFPSPREVGPLLQYKHIGEMPPPATLLDLARCGIVE